MKKRRVSAYTRIGERIATLSRGRQLELSEVLGISQQSVSKKLRGTRPILVSDLEKLSKHYNVSLTYFFEDPEHSEMPPELATACARAKESSGPFRDIVVRLSKLPDPVLEYVAPIISAVDRSADRNYRPGGRR